MGIQNTPKYVWVFFLLPLFTVGQNLMPPIQNYRIFEYKADSKNWGLSASEDGELFVANNQGLLHFNGEEWELHKLPHETTIRSVAHTNGKIFTGSYEEFGYWQKNSFGDLVYTSLTYLIKDHQFTNEEFWQILPYEKGLLFRSFSTIYQYQNDAITVIDVDIVVSKIAPFQDKIVVAGGEGELYRFDNLKLTRFVDDGMLNGKTIIDMVQTEEGLLIGTRLDGCYLLQGGVLRPWDDTINEELKMQQLNRILPLDSGKLVFGTIKNGIYVYDVAQGIWDILNRENGLQNNTVLAMLQYNDQLWAGLDNGIDRIQLNNPITYYTEPTGALGTVYDIALHDDILYLGSNTGIYYVQNDSLNFVNGSQGHVWDLEVIEDDLFGGHNTGTFRLDDGQIKDFFNYSGGYQMAKVPNQQEMYIQGTYNGFVKFLKSQSGAWVAEKIDGMDRPVEQLCFENEHTVWAAHPYKGFYRVKIDSEFSKVLEYQEYKTDSIPDNYNIELFNVKNQIVFNNQGRWYKYDPILDRIIVFEEFEPYTNKKLLYHDESHFWFLDNQSKEVTFTDFKGKDLILEESQLTRRQVPEAENIIKQSDSAYYFTLGDGYAKIDLAELQYHVESLQLSTPKLNSFIAGNEKRPIDKATITLSFLEAKTIEIKVSAPKEVDSKYYYELKSESDTVQSGFSDHGTLNFQNLDYGKYLLRIAAVGIDNQKSEALEVSFQIKPPWYLSNASIVGYLLAGIGVFYLIRIYNRRKLGRKQQELKDQLIREQEDKLAKLEKEKLAKEVKLKQNELTISTMNVAEKNELLLELKSMLLMGKEQFSDKRRYRAFMKKLDNSIHGDGDWKRFEYNFNELHDDFFEKLLKKYPKLTPKDLKLCAYLKMNLSTKEIAPLMAISVRGVEIHRYRLRKKLGIASSENISNFLITFK